MTIVFGFAMQKKNIYCTNKKHNFGISPLIKSKLLICLIYIYKILNIYKKKPHVSQIMYYWI